MRRVVLIEIHCDDNSQKPTNLWHNVLIFWLLFSVSAFPIIPTRKILFKPNIEADEEISAAHFLDFEFCDAMAAVPPGDRDRGERKSAHDGFQGEFDGDVEVGAEDRANAVDDGLPS